MNPIVGHPGWSAPRAADRSSQRSDLARRAASVRLGLCWAERRNPGRTGPTRQVAKTSPDQPEPNQAASGQQDRAALLMRLGSRFLVLVTAAEPLPPAGLASWLAAEVVRTSRTRRLISAAVGRPSFGEYASDVILLRSCLKGRAWIRAPDLNGPLPSWPAR